MYWRLAVLPTDYRKWFSRLMYLPRMRVICRNDKIYNILHVVLITALHDICTKSVFQRHLMVIQQRTLYQPRMSVASTMKSA